jgi:predicted O-methyltransferase YrrM
MEKAFNGDHLILEEFKKLIKNFNIKYIIETGTFEGDTTMALACIAQHVHTIEISDQYLAKAKEKLKDLANIYFYKGSSPEVLNEILRGAENNILFFLDAHWNSYNPLIDELKVIHKHGLKPVIAIHDFKVPGKPFGFDSYGGQDYDWAWIEESIKAIYGDEGFTYWYNSEAHGAQRGIVYIVPGTNYQQVELSNMGDLNQAPDNVTLNSSNEVQNDINPKPNESGKKKPRNKGLGN